MSSSSAEIEQFDRRHLRQIAAELVLYAISISLLLVRFFFGVYGLNQRPPGFVVLGLLIAALISLTACAVLQLRLWRRISRNPEWAAALNNEMVQALGASAWLWGFLGAAGSVLFFAILSAFGLVADPVTIAVATILSGRGAQRTAFFVGYRAA